MRERRRVHHLLDDLAPGARLDLDDIRKTYGPEFMDHFLDEFEGASFLLSPEGVVGVLEDCPDCDGLAEDDEGKTCETCQGYSMLQDFGDGKKTPYRD